MKVKPFLLIVCLMGITVAAMMVVSKMDAVMPAAAEQTDTASGMMTGQVRLTQSKVLKNGDGTVAVAVSMTANEMKSPYQHMHRPVDMVVVMDRSGSMQGEKIEHAKRALDQLIKDLSPTDRLALVTYSNRASVESGLTAMTPENRQRMAESIRAMDVGGGTNLSDGLMAGVNLMPPPTNRLTIRHLLVISDGLANEGITDVATLGQMAAQTGDKNISIGTVGVGDDFNEHLMSLLADRGQGRYYYMEDPAAFAGLFTEEYRRLGQIAASNMRLEIQLGQNTTLLDASGYSIEQSHGFAYVGLGNINSRDTRTLYLTFKVPTQQTGSVNLGKILLAYQHQDQTFTLPLGPALNLACIEDPDAVYASIEKESWGRKVLQNDYSRLKKGVAQDISQGNKAEALKRLEDYRVRQAELNAVIGSEAVQNNLDQEVEVLRKQIQETFEGAPHQVEQKQKRAAKSLHYDGYLKERAIGPASSKNP